MQKIITVPEKIFSNPKYQGKHIVLQGNKVLAVGTWTKVSKAFDALLKKSKTSPTLTYIPKENTLVL